MRLPRLRELPAPAIFEVAIAEPDRHLYLFESADRRPVPIVRRPRVSQLFLQPAEQHLGVGQDDPLAKRFTHVECRLEVAAGLPPPARPPADLPPGGQYESATPPVR